MKYFNKKNLLLSLTVIMGCLSIHNAAGPGAISNVDCTGSPFATNTSSPTCNTPSCHNGGGSFTPVFTLQLLSGVNPVTYYVPNGNYTLRMTSTSATGILATTRYGFQAVCVQASTTASSGTWGIMPTGYHTVLVNSRYYVEQTVTQSIGTIDIPWTAPNTGTGTVKFYGAGLIADGNTLASGDSCATAILSIAESTACVQPVIVDTATNVLCHGGATGSIHIGVTSGTPPYVYSWTGPGTFTASTQNLSNVGAGTYTVTVSGGICSQTKTVIITEPTALSAAATATSTICEGNTLLFTGSAFGGTTPYSYSWTGPNGFTSNIASPSIPLIPIADSGNYVLTVTDANGCTASSTHHVTVLPGVILTSLNSSILCYGQTNGAIQLFAAGSAATPFTYAWTGPGSFSSTSQSIANLSAGTYTVVATPASGSCTQTLSYTVTAPTALTATASDSSSPICQGTRAALVGTGSGGTGTLSYHWSGPNNFFSNSQNPGISSAIGFNASGVYTLSATDANGCNTTATVTVVVDTVPTVTVAASNALCYGTSTGSVTSTEVNGAPYTYSWTGPNGYTASTQNISAIPAGTYTVSVTSNLGCSASKSATVSQPATAVSGTASSNSPVCNNGTLDLYANGTGGTGTLTYSWTGPNGYSSFIPDPVISPITSTGTGTYKLSIMDANGCTDTISTPVALSVAPVVTATVTNAACYGGSTGSIATTIAGGSPPFTYAWTGPNGYTSSAANPSNLPAGIYSVTVNGACVGLSSASAIVSQPAAITDTVFANTPACAGTLLNITSVVNGGTGNYSYSWTGPNNFISTSSDPVILSAPTAATGTYTLVIRDANNCLKASQLAIVVDTAPTVHLADTSYCPGSTVALNAGNPGASYLWNTGATTRTINVGTAGTYNVIVTNAYGCPSTSSANVTAGAKATASGINSTGVTGNPGGFNFSAINPSSVTEYLWDFGDGTTFVSATPTHFYTAKGTYTVKLYAINACGADTLSTQVTVSAVTGVQNVTNTNNGITIYPNPTRDYVIIDNSSNLTLKSVKAINVLGATIFESHIDGQQSYRVNTGAFAPGVYTLYIETNEGTVVRKLDVVK